MTHRLHILLATVLATAGCWVALTASASASANPLATSPCGSAGNIFYPHVIGPNGYTYLYLECGTPSTRWFTAPGWGNNPYQVRFCRIVNYSDFAYNVYTRRYVIISQSPPYCVTERGSNFILTGGWSMLFHVVGVPAGTWFAIVSTPNGDWVPSNSLVVV